MKIKIRRIHWRVLIFCLLLATILGWTSCYRKYGMTDTDIQNYYSIRKYIPQFKLYSIENRPIHYVEIGPDSLPLLIFIHGAPGAWYGYIQLLDDKELQSKFKMISVDRPGYGKSGAGMLEFSIEKQARLLQPLLDSHKTGKPVYIIGRSFGAPVAARIAFSNQDKVKSLFLLGADIDPDKEKFWWFSGFGRWYLFRWILPQSINTATDEKFTRVKELRKMTPLWKDIHIPVILMHGENDWIVDTSNLSFAKKMLINSPNSKFIKIPGAGHLVSSERPDLLKIELFKSLNKKN